MSVRLFRTVVRSLIVLDRIQLFYSRHSYVRFGLIAAFNIYAALSSSSSFPSLQNGSANTSPPSTNDDSRPFSKSLKIFIYIFFNSLFVSRTLLITVTAPITITLFFRAAFSLHESNLSALIVVGLWAISIIKWLRSKRVNEYWKCGVHGLLLEQARRDYAPKLEEVWQKHEIGVRKFCGTIAGAGGIGDGLWRDGEMGIKMGLVDQPDQEEERRNKMEEWNREVGDMMKKDPTFLDQIRPNYSQGSVLVESTPEPPEVQLEGNQEKHVWKGLLWALVSTQSDTVKVFVNNAREIVSMEKDLLCDIVSNVTDLKPYSARSQQNSTIPPSGSPRDIDDDLSDDEHEEIEKERIRREIQRIQQHKDLEFHRLRSERGEKLLELTEKVGKVWARLERHVRDVQVEDEMASWVWRDLMWFSEVDKKGIGALDSRLNGGVENPASVADM
ncbi:hypothetical protein EX30DRAFT_369938 [Ascodesmis nigricans]|uniref:Uncharacterized protein n=1 Tax=Ascodesmis nigricans TaxID=341454 RepID=A0A4S2N1N1_9PEZI|nr:hypothetical protein EX30DRAFT_369938 [Ascodesmis nigricans]